MIKGVFAATLLAASLVFIETGAREVYAQERNLVVPLRTLYPNEVIKREDFAVRPFIYNPDGPSRFVESIENFVGLSAKSTLPAFRPVHVSAFEMKRQVGVGTPLRLVFQEDGITIIASGLSLQKAIVGQPIQVRNSDTGAVLTGLLEGEGVVRMRSQ